MKIVNLNEHPEFFRGCGVPGRRMSDKLIELFSFSEKHLWRAQCASGVRLDFITDSCEIEYSLEFGKPVRQIFTSDIFVDGELTTVDGAGPHLITLKPGRKHVVIHLPHLVVLEKVGLKISDDSEIAAAEVPAKRLLVCGDSICQGMTTSTPSNALVPLTAAALKMDFINTSVGGAKMSAEHIKLTMEFPGDVLIMALGVNDALHKVSYDEFRSKTEDVLAAMAEFPGKKLVVLPIPNVAASTPDLPVYREIIRFIAGQYPEIKIIDGYEFFPANAELYRDNTHPNDEGSKIYAKALINAVETL